MMTTQTNRLNARRLIYVLLSGLISLGLALLITAVITNQFDPAALVALPVFWNTLAVNLLIGISLALFVLENGWGGALRILLTVAIALLIGRLILLLLSADSAKAFTALMTGPLTRINRWGNWIEDALGLTLAGLAVALVFRARLFALGGEGQVYLGAMAAGLIALYVKGLPVSVLIALAVGIACLVGFLWGVLPGFLRAYLGANELVSTLMLNEIAKRIYSLILTAIKPATAGYMVSATFAAEAVFPRIISGTRLSTAIAYVVVAVLIAWLIIQRTPFGYEIRIIGANANFARYGGINTRRTIMLAMGVSGIVAGLAGAYLALSVNQKLILGIDGGLAFEGIVVALLARNKILAVPSMALLYAYLRAGAVIMQSEARVSLEIVRVIQAIIILLVTADAVINFIRFMRNQRSVTITPTAEPVLSGEAKTLP